MVIIVDLFSFVFWTIAPLFIAMFLLAIVILYLPISDKPTTPPVIKSRDPYSDWHKTYSP